jgi:uncharacterized phage-associated protein
MTNPSRDPIKRDGIDTHRGDASSGREVRLTTIAPPPIRHSSSPDSLLASVVPPRYRAPMTTSANSVIAAIDIRRPGLKLRKKVLLLFFAQGHHLAFSGEPLFDEPIYATKDSVTVEGLTGEPSGQPTAEDALGTITDIVVRYSALSPAELRTLVQASTPWQVASKPGPDSRIDWAHLRDWFNRPEETDDPDDERPSRVERDEASAYLTSRRS